MPNFPVTEVPQRISQMLTQPALLQNIGNETIYLDSVSTVGPDSYGLGLVPRSTVNWPADRELWAATAPGTTSSVSILYNADGTALAEVNAVVSGSVDIGAPVNVQGGGEILYVDGIIPVPASNSVLISVDAPASGLRYYGLRVYFTHNGPTTPDPLQLLIQSNGPGFASSPLVGVVNPSVGAPVVGNLGVPSRAQFIVPMATDYPVDILITNEAAIDVNCSLQVNGLSHSEPKPTDADVWTASPESRVAFTGSPSGSYAIIAPSFSDRYFLLTTSTGTVGTFVVDELDTTFNTWSTTQERAQNSPYAAPVPLTSNIQAETNSLIMIPGTGQPHRVRCTNNVTGNTFLSYIGKVNG